MSGGTYNYAYMHVEEMAARILENQPPEPLRRAFGTHLLLVAKAMRDIEWVDSGDSGPGDETAAIRAVIAPAVELAQAVTDARVMVDVLKGLLACAGESR